MLGRNTPKIVGLPLLVASPHRLTHPRFFLSCFKDLGPKNPYWHSFFRFSLEEFFLWENRQLDG